MILLLLNVSKYPLTFKLTPDLIFNIILCLTHQPPLFILQDFTGRGEKKTSRKITLAYVIFLVLLFLFWVIIVMSLFPIKNKKKKRNVTRQDKRLLFVLLF